MEESNNINDLIEAIDSNDGVVNMMDCGIADIDYYDVPEELREAWDNMYDYFLDMLPEVTYFYDLLSKFRAEYEENKEF